MTDTENISILIADGDLSYCNCLRDCLKRNSFGKTDILNDCSRITEVVDKMKPDVILMDMVLPGNDGLYLMKKFCDKRQEDFSSKIIVISAFYNERYIKEASLLGAYSYMIKPVNTDILVEKIKEAVSVKKESKPILGEGNVSSIYGNVSFVREENLFSGVKEDKEENSHIKTEIKITRLLHDMGIPAHLCGHDYLRDAIIMVMESHEISGRMTKEIYPEIAKKYKKSPQSVERAIRTALDVAWTRGKTELINDIFRFTVNIQKGRPTNSEFVSLIADYLKYDGMVG